MATQEDGGQVYLTHDKTTGENKETALPNAAQRRKKKEKKEKKKKGRQQRGCETLCGAGCEASLGLARLSWHETEKKKTREKETLMIP